MSGRNRFQLLKTLSFACEDVTFADACTAAQQLIEEFSTIPLAYIRAIGSPMVSLNDIPFWEANHIDTTVASRIGWSWTLAQQLHWATATVHRISTVAYRDVSNTVALAWVCSSAQAHYELVCPWSLSLRVLERLLHQHQLQAYSFPNILNVLILSSLKVRTSSHFPILGYLSTSLEISRRSLFHQCFKHLRQEMTWTWLFLWSICSTSHGLACSRST